MKPNAPETESVPQAIDQLPEVAAGLSDQVEARRARLTTLRAQAEDQTAGALATAEIMRVDEAAAYLKVSPSMPYF